MEELIEQIEKENLEWGIRVELLGKHKSPKRKFVGWVIGGHPSGAPDWVREWRQIRFGETPKEALELAYQGYKRSCTAMFGGG